MACAQKSIALGSRLTTSRAKSGHSSRRGPYEVRHEIDGTDEVYRVRVLREPPLRLSVLAGELAHNLRSALDQLAWQLVTLNGEESPGRHTQFPISWDADKYRESSKTGTRGMSVVAVGLIESVQPYHAGPRANDHVLRLVHELDRIDKHQLLHVIGCAVQRQTVTLGGSGTGTVRFPWRAEWGAPAFGRVLGGQAIGVDDSGAAVAHIPAPDRTMTLVGPPMQPQPLRDGAELLRLRRDLGADVRVEPEFEFNVAFGDGTPAQGKVVVPLLRGLLVGTSSVVDQFAWLFA